MTGRIVRLPAIALIVRLTLPQEAQQAPERDFYPFDRPGIGQRQVDDIVAAQCHRQRRPVQRQG